MMEKARRERWSFASRKCVRRDTSPAARRAQSDVCEMEPSSQGSVLYLQGGSRGQSGICGIDPGVSSAVCRVYPPEGWSCCV